MYFICTVSALYCIQVHYTTLSAKRSGVVRHLSGGSSVLVRLEFQTPSILPLPGEDLVPEPSLKVEEAM